MKQKFKAIAAVLIGLTTALLLIMLSQTIGHFIYPIPDEFKDIDFSDPANKEQLKALMEMAPTGSLILILIGYMLASFIGAWISAWISPKHVPLTAFILGGLLTLAGVSNLQMIPHPIWFTIINLPSYLLFAWLGSKMPQPINV